MYSAAHPMGATDISEDTISALVSAAIHVGLSRRALLAGLAPAITAQLADMPRPDEQLLGDLTALREMGTLPDGTTPLQRWLKNAKLLAGPRVEARVFEAALRALESSGHP
ncbi:MAG: hypothetical protein U0441_24190 [Polyangiaceae bacterium]